MIERLRVLMLSGYMFKFDFLDTEFQLLDNSPVALPGLEAVTSLICVESNSSIVEAIGNLRILSSFFALFLFIQSVCSDCTSRSGDSTTGFVVRLKAGNKSGDVLDMPFV